MPSTSVRASARDCTDDQVERLAAVDPRTARQLSSAWHGRRPPTPTQAQPGSPEKLDVLEERARKRQAVFHPRDLSVSPRQALIDALSMHGSRPKNGTNTLERMVAVDEAAFRRDEPTPDGFRWSDADRERLARVKAILRRASS